MKTFLGVDKEGFVNGVFYQNSEDREPPEGFYEAPAEQFLWLKEILKITAGLRAYQRKILNVLKKKAKVHKLMKRKI
ncbi:hypothetical protein ACSE3M_14545 [Bacillus velezensis]